MASNVPAKTRGMKHAFSAGKLLKRKRAARHLNKDEQGSGQARFHTFLSLDAC
jgi:hypothetical protein